MNIRTQHFNFLFLAMLVGIFIPSQIFADCLELFESDHATSSISISAEYNSTNLESTDQYLSGAGGDEDWRAVHDLDGDLHGFSINIRPPALGKRFSMDFTYLTGDLEGTFNTREISPTPEGPYSGKVRFDRDEYQLGFNIFILNAVYARLEYYTFEMDGDWVYNDGSPNEPQKYELDAYNLGVGFIQDYFFKNPDSEFKRYFGLLVDVFAGCSIMDFEHTEKLTGASVETDDIGYKLRAALLATYKIGNKSRSRFFAGIGYTYKHNSDTNFDLTEDGFFSKLGIMIVF